MNKLDWKQLLNKLRPILQSGQADSNKAAISSYLREYTSDERDYEPYVFYDKNG